MARSVRHITWILIVGSLVLFANLGGPRLWDRDEPRNAGCAVEMLQRGDWVTPVFDGELRTHKPILLYWLMMAAYAVFGISEFSARFWSAALGLGTALLTYGIGRRLFSSAAGFWAAIILLTTLMFDVASRAATPDSILIFWSTAAIFVYVWGTFPNVSPDVTTVHGHEPIRLFPTAPVAILMYACMGMAVLTKGPVGFVLPTAVIGMYLLIRRLPQRDEALGVSRAIAGRRRNTGATGWHILWRIVGSVIRPFAPRHFVATCWSMRPITAIIVILLVALPWYWAVGLRTDGAWLRGFFLEHNLGRATHSLEGHRGSLIYYPVALLIGFFPWSVFAAPVAVDTTRRLRQRSPGRAGTLLALCWIGVYLGLFSVVSTKLPSYITPCYPAVALLVSCFVQDWLVGRSRAAVGWNQWAFTTLALVGLIALIAIPIVTTKLMPGDQWLAVISLIPIGTAGTALLLQRRQRNRLAVTAFAVGATLLMTSVFTVAAKQVDNRRTFDRLLARIERAADHPVIGTLGTLEPSWVFYAGHPLDRLSMDDRAAHHPTTMASDHKSENVPIQKPAISVRGYLEQGPDHFVITTDRVIQQIGPLPRHVKVLAKTKGFLKKLQLVLLGWDEEAQVTMADTRAAARR